MGVFYTHKITVINREKNKKMLAICFRFSSKFDIKIETQLIPSFDLKKLIFLNAYERL